MNLWCMANITKTVKRSHKMLNRFTVQLPVAAALLAASEIALAATASTYIPVSASVADSCTISTASAIAFGAYDPTGANKNAALNATGQISVSCSKGATGPTIGMDNGTHVAGAQRQMMGSTATNLLQYNIFQPPSSAPSTACVFPGATAWTTTGAGMLTIASAPSRVARLFNVCGTVPGGQDASPDTYTDTLGATINF
jgi:spore coat protein U-like protein